MISLCGGSSTMAYCWLTWQFAGLLTFCLTMSLQPWRPGFERIRVPRSSLAMVVFGSEMECVWARLTQFKLPIDSISCATS